ncbi:GIN domain-containing protein [uncultured Acetobacteroides sp.]|uniref:GIN domain-containing protein n=1 Tax=uncultured Acetobacteroides sp. TaxID=1760811 RepID=UPI0029F58A65|nr:DUF2807 domain-containing protein [uncultured Acetobacteroides sp.]
MRTTLKPLLLLVSMAIATASFFACNISTNNDSNKKRVEGKGDLVQKTIDLDSFTAIDIEGQADVKVTYGPKQIVKVQAQANILELLDFTVTEGKLTIGTKSNYSIQHSKGITVEIVTPNAITDYSISGAGNISIAGKPQQNLNIKIAGAAKFDAFELEADNVSIDIAGAADCDVKAAKTLDVSIAGTGSVKYKGNPTVNKSIAGIGSVKKDAE